MAPITIQKKATIIEKVQAIGSTVAAALLVKLVLMFGAFHDDILKLQKDGERRDHDIQSVQVGTNELRVGQYDINGRLKSVEALIQEQNILNKKNTR